MLSLIGLFCRISGSSWRSKAERMQVCTHWHRSECASHCAVNETQLVAATRAELHGGADLVLDLSPRITLEMRAESLAELRRRRLRFSSLLAPVRVRLNS